MKRTDGLWLSAHRQQALSRDALVRHDAEELAGRQAGVVHQHLEVATGRKPLTQLPGSIVATATPKSLATFFSGILFFSRQLRKAVAKLARMSHWNFAFWTTAGDWAKLAFWARKINLQTRVRCAERLFARSDYSPSQIGHYKCSFLHRFRGCRGAGSGRHLDRSPNDPQRRTGRQKSRPRAWCWSSRCQEGQDHQGR